MNGVKTSPNFCLMSYLIDAAGDKTRTEFATDLPPTFLVAGDAGLFESCNPLILRGVGMVGVTGLEPVTSCM